MTVVCNSLEETAAFAKRVANTLHGGECIAFTGGMGMGKTTFTRELALSLGFDGTVQSPTFAIVNEYIGGRLNIYHFDMYRINGLDDLYSTAFFEYCDDKNGVVVCEWSENINELNALPDNCIKIQIERGENDNCRIFTITPNL